MTKTGSIDAVSCYLIGSITTLSVKKVKKGTRNRAEQDFSADNAVGALLVSSYGSVTEADASSPFPKIQATFQPAVFSSVRTILCGYLWQFPTYINQQSCQTLLVLKRLSDRNVSSTEKMSDPAIAEHRQGCRLPMAHKYLGIQTAHCVAICSAIRQPSTTADLAPRLVGQEAYLLLK